MSTEKSVPSAPPPYSISYPAGDGQPGGLQYGFQPPSQQPGYPQYSQHPGYPTPGYPQPTPGYGPPPQVTQPVAVSQPTVVVMGGCPTCRVGVMEDEFTCFGILCAICFFPIGILCCLAMKEKKCTNCGATF